MSAAFRCGVCGVSLFLHGMAALYLKLFSWKKCWLSAGNHDNIHEVKADFTENCVFTEPPLQHFLVLLTFSKVKVRLLRLQLQSCFQLLAPSEGFSSGKRRSGSHASSQIKAAPRWPSGLTETLLSNTESSLRSSRTAVLITAAPSWITDCFFWLYVPGETGNQFEQNHPHE